MRNGFKTLAFLIGTIGLAVFPFTLANAAENDPLKVVKACGKRKISKAQQMAEQAACEARPADGTYGPDCECHGLAAGFVWVDNVSGHRYKDLNDSTHLNHKRGVWKSAGAEKENYQGVDRLNGRVWKLEQAINNSKLPDDLKQLLLQKQDSIAKMDGDSEEKNRKISDLERRLQAAEKLLEAGAQKRVIVEVVTGLIESGELDIILDKYIRTAVPTQSGFQLKMSPFIKGQSSWKVDGVQVRGPAFGGVMLDVGYQTIMYNRHNFLVDLMFGLGAEGAEVQDSPVTLLGGLGMEYCYFANHVFCPGGKFALFYQNTAPNGAEDVYLFAGPSVGLPLHLSEETRLRFGLSLGPTLSLATMYGAQNNAPDVGIMLKLDILNLDVAKLVEHRFYE